MDVKTTFLNGVIEEEVYIEKPKGFVTFNNKSHVCRLKRALYGLKKEPRAWYTRIDNYLTDDDKLIRSCKEDLTREFEMKDMELTLYFLRLEVWQVDGELIISQGKYANEILKNFDMESSKRMETPLATSWRKEDATSSEVVEATIYRYPVGSLIYPVNT
eukprot:PITA_33450